MVTSARANELFRPLVFLSIAAALMLFVGGLTMMYNIDNTARLRDQSLVANGVKAGILDLYKDVWAIAAWDDALINLERRNSEWAAEYMGRYYYQIAGYDYVFVLDHDDHLFFAAHKGSVRAASIYTGFAGGMHQAIETVRKRERERQNRAQPGAPLRLPLTVHNIMRVNGQVYIVVVALVQSDFRKAEQMYARAPIIVAAYPIAGNFLSHLSARYLQPDLHILQKQQAPSHEMARINLNDDHGRYVATLEWKAATPGTWLATRLAVPALAIVILFFLAVLAMQRRSWRAAQALIASEARASHMAYHDPLTGLPNRLLFFDRLGSALEQVRRKSTTIAVHCIDLDRFKEVNDTFGHQMGDELIRAAAHRISGICRRSDTFARLSGDEFAIVQLNASPLAAARLAERIVEVMAQPMDLSGGRVHVSCSLGVNTVPEIVGDMEVSAAEILRQADLALYRAKNNGRGQYCFFEPEMDAAMRMRREIELDLREALDQGGLRMVYQPQADKYGRIVGVEALVRWHHPVRGDVSPAMFIQIAEECGLINDVGFFTLREAFAASHLWKGLKVAINISASQLRMRDFHEKISALVEECGVDPCDFELEITEGLLLGDDPVTHTVLMRLRHMGFSIALDDFGTGYSSLSYLQRYPIDKIKIDRSFIANLGVEGEARAVVQAIVRLARALRLHVIAEGVETDEQRDYLINVGCEEIQGFLFSRPVEPAAISEMYAHNREPALRTVD
ncbi:MAG: EAL domain-containing protein [Sphingomonadales bacterium]|nr:MAG: EAL domain-containing protein [Sphingomonadales bacterium]TNF04673.1 MAG: EAL domain-containing protein [Sphingomonadales bacterium]